MSFMFTIINLHVNQCLSVQSNSNPLSQLTLVRFQIGTSLYAYVKTYLEQVVPEWLGHQTLVLGSGDI